MNVIKGIKEKTRKAEYFLKNKDEVQVRLLEATRDDDDQITDAEYLTIAHLTFERAAIGSIKKTILKRFKRVKKAPVCCRKALDILDYCVRYGDEKVRDWVIQAEGALIEVSRSHHFNSEKPREYMAEEQCRNHAKNLIEFVKDKKQYDEVRASSQQQRDRVAKFYVQPLEVKIKSSSNVLTTSTKGQTFSAKEVSTANNPYKIDNDRNNKINYTSSSSDNSDEYSYEDDDMPDPSSYKPQNNSRTQNIPRHEGSGGNLQSGQQGFSIFNSAPPQKASQGGFPQQQTNPFQQQQQPNPFQQQHPNPFQQQQPNPFQQQQPNPFQQRQNPFGNQPPPQQQQNQWSPFSQQPAQQTSYGSQLLNSMSQQPPQNQSFQQPLSADELLFGPTPTQQKPQQPFQQQPQQIQTPQADPAYDGILDFSNIPIQQIAPGPEKQNGGGLLDEFGDLVDLDLQKKPPREHGKPENFERGYQNQSPFF